jgi:photosystem II stability/assembly factor-like uncharacterized protein
MRRALAAAALLLASGAAQATGVDPALLQNLHWRSIGPFRGGRVLAVAGAPDDHQRFYFGAVDGGVWRTDDAGRSWAPIFDAVPVGSIGALAVAPSAPQVIYAGTGEADMRSDIAQGIGMFRSEDGGDHWASAGLADSQQIGAIVVDPRDPRVLLVAALGHPYGPNPMRGIYRSSDGGRSWARTLFRDADTGGIDLAFRPGQPDVVYAALWQTRRPPWNVYPPSSGPGSGLYKSIDNGRNWTLLHGHGLPDAPGRIGIATSPARPDRVYALIAGPEGGLFRSDDNGANWAKVSSDKRITERGWYFSGITADPANADIVYVCDTILLRSNDGGAHFIPLKGDPTGDDFHTLWIDPRDSSRRILGVDQGALVSVNGGASWSSWYNQPTGQFYHVSTDSRFPYRVYGAQQDSGAAGVDSRSDSPMDGISMMEFHESAAGGESDNIAPDPDDPDTVYGGRVDKLDLRSHQMRSIDPLLALPGTERVTWTLPLAWGKPDGCARCRTLYFADQQVFATSNGGDRWRRVSPDLTRANPGVPGTLDAPTARDLPQDLPGAGKRRGVVYALGPSPLAASLLWAGTDDGLVWRTTDGGAHWTDVTPQGLPAWSKIGVVEPSHSDPATAYIAVDRHRLDDAKPYLYRTHDAGAHWTAIVRGLPTGALSSVHVVREDPQRPGLLYAGTESGAFVSFDDGGQWQALQNGLPPTSVRDIVLHGDDLVLATHGRGFYIMDDIDDLRDLAAGPRAGPLLFPVADAIRVHPPEFTGTPLPKDEPAAANPPGGMIIDYALPAAGARSVEVDITDASGEVLRRLRSDDAVPALDLATLPTAPEWVDRPHPPPLTAGAHRVVWDLRTAAPVAAPGDEHPIEGVWAPPASYSIALIVDGQVQRRTAHVLADPRLRLGPHDLMDQFALARRIQAARIAARAALAQATSLRKTLAAQAGGDPQRRAAVAARLATLDALIDPSQDDPPATGAAPWNGLSEVSTRLDALAQAVDGSDGAPTHDAIAGFATADAALRSATAVLAQAAAAAR